MVKKISDFATKKAYLEYIQTEEFIANYSLEGKTANELIEDLYLYPDWKEYVDKAIEFIKNRPPRWGEKWDSFQFRSVVEEFVEMSDPYEWEKPLH